MRPSIAGLVAAIAVVIAGAAPAQACGGGGLFQSPCARTHMPVDERMAGPARRPDAGAPQQQYYFVNQGPTYTGPGHLLIYRESAVHRRHTHPRFHHGHARHHGMRHGPHAHKMHGHVMRHHH